MSLLEKLWLIYAPKDTNMRMFIEELPVIMKKKELTNQPLIDNWTSYSHILSELSI